MDKKDTRLLQQRPGSETLNQNWNIVEIASRQKIQHSVNQFIYYAHISTAHRQDLERDLFHLIDTYGRRVLTYLVRSLLHHDTDERETIVYLLTLLNDPETIPMLEAVANNEHYRRSIRLSASLALAGMGATRETQSQETIRTVRQYAIS